MLRLVMCCRGVPLSLALQVLSKSRPAQAVHMTAYHIALVWMSVMFPNAVLVLVTLAGANGNQVKACTYTHITRTLVPSCGVRGTDSWAVYM
jgi:hypothetical protein